MTFRLRIINEERWKNFIKQGESILFCAWHQQFFSAIHHFATYKKYTPALMISRSRDGDLIAGVANKSGWRTARGSSSKGGISAMNAIIEHLKKYKLASHIADGPTGPIGKVKAGVINIAHKSNAVVVPFYIKAEKAWYFNSWDSFMLPKPFSKVTLTFGEEIRFEPTENSDAFNQQLKYLEDTMLPQLVRP